MLEVGCPPDDGGDQHVCVVTWRRVGNRELSWEGM